MAVSLYHGRFAFWREFSVFSRIMQTSAAGKCEDVDHGKKGLPDSVFCQYRYLTRDGRIFCIMNLNIAICDDEEHVLERYAKAVNELLSGTHSHVHTFTSKESILQAYSADGLTD